MSTLPDITDRPAARTLTPVLSAKYALRWPHCALVSAFVLLFMCAGYLPLVHVGTWSHAAVGDWVLSHGALPTMRPGAPLAEGQRWFADAWLTDTLMAAAHRAAGVEAVSWMFAVVMLAIALLAARTAYLLSDRKRFALLAAMCVAGFHFNLVAVVGPELLASLCLVTLLWMLVAAEHGRDASQEAAPPGWLWAAAPALMVLWANLSGSVFVGAAVLASWAAGRWIDAAIDRRGLVAGAARADVRNSVLLAQLAIACSLLQPQGLDLWADWTLGAEGVVVASLGGYQPLGLISGAGAGCLIVWALAAVALRLSPRRVSAREAAYMLVGSILAAYNASWAVWFAPLAAVALAPHLAAIAKQSGWLGPKPRVRDFEPGQPVPVGTFAYTLVALLLVWIGFALSPVSNLVLGGKPRGRDRVMAAATPLAAGDYLAEHRPAGLVWTPADWGDWLRCAAPGIDVSADARWTSLPRQARYDIARVYRAEGDWTRALDRYGVALLVLDKSRHQALWEAASVDANWSVALEAGNQAILARKEG